MKGYTVGAQKGTAFVEPLQKSGLFADVKIYDTIPAILARREQRAHPGRLRRQARSSPTTCSRACSPKRA